MGLDLGRCKLGAADRCPDNTRKASLIGSNTEKGMGNIKPDTVPANDADWREPFLFFFLLWESTFLICLCSLNGVFYPLQLKSLIPRGWRLAHMVACLTPGHVISSSLVAFLLLWLGKFTCSESGSHGKETRQWNQTKMGRKLLLYETMVSGDP